MAKGFTVVRRLPDQLRLDPLMGQMLESVAVMAADAAQRIAPVGDSAPGEHYRDQIKAEAKITSKRGGWRGRVNAFKFTSLFIEFGTGLPGRTPVFAPLRRGAQMVGLSFSRVRRRK